ncbi:hypothetical protein PR048_023869 [Dryococelus australis]|uniref:Maturase K n=1 Tax=Dryococelus australis TaxID=614101 RepID=A0ABQ9GVE3_9NEOP|nr:hypothetical protein PR048_023869 [Dryococelus australis]
MMMVSMIYKIRVMILHFTHETVCSSCQNLANSRLPELRRSRGIVRHDYHMRKSKVTRPGIEPGLPWWEASGLTARSPSPHCMNCQRLTRIRMLELQLFPAKHRSLCERFFTLFDLIQTFSRKTLLFKDIFKELQFRIAVSFFSEVKYKKSSDITEFRWLYRHSLWNIRNLSTPECFSPLAQTFWFPALEIRIDDSPHTNANQARFPNFRMYESCQTMPLVGGFSRGSPVSPDLKFPRCSILSSLHPSSAFKAKSLRSLHCFPTDMYVPHHPPLPLK